MFRVSTTLTHGSVGTVTDRMVFFDLPCAEYDVKVFHHGQQDLDRLCIDPVVAMDVVGAEQWLLAFAQVRGSELDF